MNARCFAGGTRLIYRRGQECRRQCYRPHPECGFCYGFRPLIPFSAPRPQSLPSPSIFGRRLRFAPLSTKNRCGLRGDRLRPPLATTSTTSLARCGFATATLPAVTNYLQRLRSRFTPPPLLCRGVGPLHSAVDPKPPLAFPTCQCRCATLQAPIAPAPYCQPRSSHPLRKLPPTFQALGICPNPRPRCAVRRCTDATPADGQPLMSASSGLRRTARRGRLTLTPQADFRDSLSLHKFHDTPLCRSLQAANAPLAVLPPSRATSSSPPIASFNPST